ncbi:MAG: fused MFS/spermidine synthase [Atopobiaceae bacterium]|nr:fused MFS/spermidine synthase [Atopobiaceae bacterium]
MRTVVAADDSDVRVLVSGGVFQSATFLDERRFDPVFAYQRAFDVAFEAVPGARRVLMLGGGGYAWPKHVLATRPEVALDVVELDPAVTAAAGRWFFLDEARETFDPDGTRLRILTGDARELLDRAGVPGRAGADDGLRETYDVIVDDCFSGHEPVASLSTVEAAEAVRRRLAPDGVYLANVVSAEEGRDLAFLRDEVATLSAVFPRVCVIPCVDDEFGGGDSGGEDNYLVVAGNRDHELPGAVPFDDDFLGEVLTDGGQGGHAGGLRP